MTELVATNIVAHWPWKQWLTAMLGLVPKNYGINFFTLPIFNKKNIKLNYWGNFKNEVDLKKYNNLKNEEDKKSDNPKIWVFMGK